MLNFINSWIKGIVIAVIISTIIEMILPKGSIKKYVKCVIGVYIVFSIINPFLIKNNESIFKYNQLELPKTAATEVISIDTDSYIEEIYTEKIEDEIQKNLENMGYEVIMIKLDIDKTQKNYGRINKVNLKIINKQNRLSKVEKVEIYIGKDENKVVNDIKSSEKDMIKNFLNKNYDIDIENIYINK